jgi:hypothetical protein
MEVASLKNTTPANEHSKEEDEDKVIYLWMYNYAICPECGGYVWKTDKEIYNQGRGVASCVNCGHQAWFTFFINEKPIGWVIPKEDVFFLLGKKELP